MNGTPRGSHVVNGTPRGSPVVAVRVATVTQAAARHSSDCAHVVVGTAMLAGALAHERVVGLHAQWVMVPNVTADDQIVCHRIPPAGSVAETMLPPPS